MRERETERERGGGRLQTERKKVMWGGREGKGEIQIGAIDKKILRIPFSVNL